MGSGIVKALLDKGKQPKGPLWATTSSPVLRELSEEYSQRFLIWKRVRDSVMLCLLIVNLIRQFPLKMMDSALESPTLEILLNVSYNNETDVDGTRESFELLCILPF